jgi:hypothetical protein
VPWWQKGKEFRRGPNSRSPTFRPIRNDLRRRRVLFPDFYPNDNERVPALVEQARASLPAGRMATLAYDKAADDEKVYEFLHQAGIKPLIHNRALWQDDPERLLPGKAGRYPLHAMHDEAGTVYSATTG